MDPRHIGPFGDGCMKSDVGQRKYVLVEDMPSRLVPASPFPPPHSSSFFYIIIIIIEHDSKWRPLLVFDLRLHSRQRHTKGKEWNLSAAGHPRPTRLASRSSFLSIKCRSGSNSCPIGGFSTATDPSQAPFILHSAAGHICTTSLLTSILTSFLPFSSSSASGISSSTYTADIPG